MRLLVCSCLVACFAASWVAADVRAAENRVVRDEANLFSSDTRQQAETRIEEIRRLYKMTMVVETAPAMPGIKRKQWRWFDVQISGQAYTRWAEERATAAGNPDIYVLICRDPLRVRVVASPGASEDAFKEKDASRLRARLEKALQDKRSDPGLLQGIDFVAAALHNHEHAETELALTGRWWVLWLVPGILVAWLCINILRRHVSADPARVKTGIDASGNNGMRTGLLGGMIGGMAGEGISDLVGRPAEKRARQVSALPPEEQAPVERGDVGAYMNEGPAYAAMYGNGEDY